MASSSPFLSSPDGPPPPIVVGLTGASGSILGLRLIETLLRLNQPVEVILTEKSYPVILAETGLKIGGASKQQALLDYFGLDAAYADRLHVFENNRLDAPPASGTHMTRGMVILPCSMGTLGRIANGISDNLISRAADVTLKEHRKLIIVPRESPLNPIHLKNLLTLSQCGVTIVPPMLTFYLPDFDSLDGQIAYTIGKVLDQLGIPHQLHLRWGDPA